MDLRILFIVSVGILLFTLYYLEREIGREPVFWVYASLGLFFSIVSVLAVATNHPSYDYFLSFTTLFILIAILYYGTEGEGGEEVSEKLTPPPSGEEKKKRKPRKRKGKKEEGPAS